MTRRRLAFGNPLLIQLMSIGAESMKFSGIFTKMLAFREGMNIVASLQGDVVLGLAGIFDQVSRPVIIGTPRLTPTQAFEAPGIDLDLCRKRILWKVWLRGDSATFLYTLGRYFYVVLTPPRVDTSMAGLHSWFLPHRFPTPSRPGPQTGLHDPPPLVSLASLGVFLARPLHRIQPFRRTDRLRFQTLGYFFCPHLRLRPGTACTLVGRAEVLWNFGLLSILALIPPLFFCFLLPRARGRIDRFNRITRCPIQRTREDIYT